MTSIEIEIEQFFDDRKHMQSEWHREKARKVKSKICVGEKDFKVHKMGVLIKETP